MVENLSILPKDLTETFKGGVIMDVVNAEQAIIAENRAVA